MIGDPGYSDHPRSRGEYRAKRCTFSQHIGSSPLSRGILNTNQIVQSNTRIIPALAGNTRLGKPQFRGSWDHPRSRGEYLSLVLLYSYWCGSSPLSRGIPRLDAGYARKAWIIPALAGNTTIAAVPAVGSPDHPRSRGEYENSSSSPTVSPGSSPLSRGIPNSERIPTHTGRIIPALAGNTTQLNL